MALTNKRLPSLQLSDTRTFHIVYHPMIIKDPEAALRSIGGFQNFTKVVQDHRSLTLNVQPDNEYHAGMFNERPKTGKTMVQLVVKFQKNKRTGAIRSQCIGIVKNSYHFNSLCDFQFLPLETEAGSSDVFHDLVPKIVPSNLADSLCWWDRPSVDEDSILQNYLPPYIFSRYTKPSNRIFTPEEIPVKEVPDTSSNAELIAVNRRPERKSFAIIVQGTEEFPSHPSIEAVEDVNSRCRPQEPHDLLYELFNKRPMWTRPAIMAETGLEDTLLKAILPKFAFYITSGPFGRCWCRFGYDPRQNPEAKAYQSIAVSFRFNDQIPEKLRLKICGRTTHSKTEHAPTTDYKFISGILPSARQMWYCVCDIKLPIAEETLKNDTTHMRPVYENSSGWLSPEGVEALREAIKTDVLQTMATIREQEGEALFASSTDYDPDGSMDELF